jgi:hypothetical protein
MNGNQFILSKDGVAVAAIVSHEAETQADQIEVASKTQGQYREYMAGRRHWQMTVDRLMVSSYMMLSLLQIGQTFTLSSYDREHANVNVHGEAKLERCNIVMAIGQLVRGFFLFRGNGDLFAQHSSGDFNFDFSNDFLI